MRRHAMTREQALKALELHTGASFQEIKQAYRDLALVWHPDRFAHRSRLQEKASERLKEINTAYDVLRSYDDGPPRVHEPKTKHTGSKHGASGTEQSGTQRQRSRTKNRGARSSAEQTEPQNSSKRGVPVNQPLLRPVHVWVVFAVLLFVAVIVGLLNDRPTGDEPANLRTDSATPVLAVLEPEADASGASSPFNPHDPQGSEDSLQQEPIDLLSLSRGDSRPEEQAIDPLQFYRPKTQPNEVRSPAADTGASFPGDLGTDSANSVLAVREPEVAGLGSSSLYFTRGSHQDDVLRIQGTPSSIDRYASLGHEVWRYGSSSVDISLQDGLVMQWNDRGNLKVRMDAGANVTGARTFTRGSHQDDVLRIQGTPSSIDRYASLGHEVWRYGSSSVDISLQDGLVMQWNDRGNLKVRMDAGANVTGARTFTRGSHQDDVLRIQGTPSSIDRYASLGHEVWRYGSSSVDISLQDGLVMQWNDRGNLKVRMDAGANVTGARTFTRGSHQDDVLRIQGTPSSIDRYASLGHEVWRYGSSSVDISLQDGLVMQWNDRGNLKVRMDAGANVTGARTFTRGSHQDDVLRPGRSEGMTVYEGKGGERISQ